MLGPLELAGSYVSGLMAWRDLDVMRLVGADSSPHDVLGLLARLVEVPGVVAYACHDERGPRSPTGERRDERYHVPVTLARDGVEWRIDLRCGCTTTTQRDRVARGPPRADHAPTSGWPCCGSRTCGTAGPSTPDQVGGTKIYAAVLDSGVRTPEEFAAWLEARALG